MTIVRQVTGVLAWAGLVVVIAVPAAELVLSKISAMTSPEVATATVAPKTAQPAPVTAKVAPLPQQPVVPASAVVATLPSQLPTMPAAAAPAKPTPAPVAVAGTATDDEALPADPVKDYLATGKPLPSYLTPSDEGTRADATPSVSIPASPVVNASAGSDPTTTGTISAPIQASPTGAVDGDAAAPITPPVPMPASARPKGEPLATVTEADLKDWKSGSLEDYLRQHGLLNGATTTAAAGN